MLLPTTKTPPKPSLSDYTILVYGPTKIGKTTWCSHAENALFLSTEPGLNALEVFQLPISSWEELLEACAEISKGEHSYKTIIIDTIDNAHRMCTEYICRKFNIQHESDLPRSKGYGLVNSELYRVLNKLAMMPYGLYLISHSQEIELESRTGKYTKIVPSLPEKPRKLVLGLVDIVLYCNVEMSQGPDGQPAVRRVMRTKPSPFYEAGERTARLPEVIDLDYGKFFDAFNSAPAAKAAKKEVFK